MEAPLKRRPSDFCCPLVIHPVPFVIQVQEVWRIFVGTTLFHPVREASLFMGWGTGNNGNFYNSHELPYIFAKFFKSILIDPT